VPGLPQLPQLASVVRLEAGSRRLHGRVVGVGGQENYLRVDRDNHDQEKNLQVP
jgi:hypothetical protein